MSRAVMLAGGGILVGFVVTNLIIIIFNIIDGSPVGSFKKMWTPMLPYVLSCGCRLVGLPTLPGPLCSCRCCVDGSTRPEREGPDDRPRRRPPPPQHLDCCWTGTAKNVSLFSS